MFETGRSEDTNFPSQNNFPAIAFFHDFECLLKFSVMEAVRNNRCDIQTRQQHLLHFVPGFIHLAAINAL